MKARFPLAPRVAPAALFAMAASIACVPTSSPPAPIAVTRAPMAAPAPPPAFVPPLPASLEPAPLQAAPAASPSVTPFVAETPPSLEEDILRWTNVERLAAGLDALRWSETLARAARAHSEEMVRLRYFAHESPEPSRRTALQRAKLAGLQIGVTLMVGENLFRGNWRRERARRIVSAWMRSPGHRANILRGAFEHLGVGVAWDRDYVLVTQVFSATP